MRSKTLVWMIIFSLFSIILFFVLYDRCSFLVYKEITNAKIVNLRKSDDESKLIVSLEYDINKQKIQNEKVIKFSFYEDFKNKKNVEIYYNAKSVKKIYFVEYGPTIIGDIIIIFIPFVLFLVAILNTVRKTKTPAAQRVS